jgi:chemotaxis protein MotA
MVDLSTLIGIVSGGALTVAALVLGGGAIGQLIDLPGLLITVGGTIAASCIRHRLGEVLRSFAIVMKSITVRAVNPVDTVTKIVEMAQVARKDGILGLEKIKTSNPFLQSAINHCVDGADPEYLKHMLTKELDYMVERHAKGISILEGWGESAPAFGLVGTVIGLVLMLGQMEDPSKIGSAIAIALLSTLYGLIIAHGFALPLASKLAAYSREEQIVKQIIIDGMIGIQKGVSPHLLQEALKGMLPPKARDF